MTLVEEISLYKNIVMEDSGRVYFEGILCMLDEPSTQDVKGSKGRRILVTTTAAKEALPTLIGASVNATLDWKGHNYNETIGMITHAWIDSNKLWVRGFLSTVKRPDIINAIEKVQGKLGMSFLINKAEVVNVIAPIWRITKIKDFEHVSILYKKSAGYAKSTFDLIK